jgi:hypothetical protein
MGSGTWSGYVAANWQGTAQISSGTMTIQSTTAGSTSNIAVGDIFVFYNSSVGGYGYPCAVVSSGSGSTWSMGGCPGFGVPTVASGGTGYDAQAYVVSISSGTGPDNAGIITGQSEPAATFFTGQTPGFNTPNTTGTGHYALFNLSGAAIVSAGTGSGGTCTSGCVTFGSNRYSSYKPELFFQGSASMQATYFDNYGFTVN